MKRRLFDNKRNTVIFGVSFLLCLNSILTIWQVHGVFKDGLWVDSNEKTASTFIWILQKNSGLKFFLITAGTTVACGVALIFFSCLIKSKGETIRQIMFSSCISCVMLFGAYFLLILSITGISFFKDLSFDLSPFQSLGEIVQGLCGTVFWLVFVDSLPFCITALVCGVIAFFLRKKKHDI